MHLLAVQLRVSLFLGLWQHHSPLSFNIVVLGLSTKRYQHRLMKRAQVERIFRKGYILETNMADKRSMMTT